MASAIPNVAALLHHDVEKLATVVFLNDQQILNRAVCRAVVSEVQGDLVQGQILTKQALYEPLRPLGGVVGYNRYV